MPASLHGWTPLSSGKVRDIYAPDEAVVGPAPEHARRPGPPASREGGPGGAPHGDVGSHQRLRLRAADRRSAARARSSTSWPSGGWASCVTSSKTTCWPWAAKVPAEASRALEGAPAHALRRARRGRRARGRVPQPVHDPHRMRRARLPDGLRPGGVPRVGVRVRHHPARGADRGLAPGGADLHARGEGRAGRARREHHLRADRRADRRGATRPRSATCRSPCTGPPATSPPSAASSSRTRSSSSVSTCPRARSCSRTRSSPPTPRASGPRTSWVEGQVTPSFDKQYVRDWLTSDESGWDRASGRESARAARRRRRRDRRPLRRGVSPTHRGWTRSCN